MDDKTLYTQDGTAIPWFTRTCEIFLDLTTFIFGGTDSGKTTIIEEILHFIKDECPNYIVICPKTSLKAYQKKLPARCIKEDLSKARLVCIWERQYNLTQVYNIANDMDVLRSLFAKAPSNETKVMLTAIKDRASKYITRIQRSGGLDYAQKKAQINKIEELLQRQTKKIYKEFVKKHKDRLLTKSLTREEKVAVEYAGLNPKLTLIIDDCTEKIEGWLKYFKKGEDNIMQKILFKGRHNNITLILAAHDDKFLPTELRKNARVTYFTQSAALQASLSKKGSGYSTKDRKKAEIMGDSIFDDEEAKIRTHKKFVMLKNVSKPFRYVIANIYPEARLGSDQLYELASKMPTKLDDYDDNPYLQKTSDKPRKKRQPNFMGSKGRHKFS